MVLNKWKQDLDEKHFKVASYWKTAWNFIGYFITPRKILLTIFIFNSFYPPPLRHQILINFNNDNTLKEFK